MVRVGKLYGGLQVGSIEGGGGRQGEAKVGLGAEFWVFWVERIRIVVVCVCVPF